MGICFERKNPQFSDHLLNPNFSLKSAVMGSKSSDKNSSDPLPSTSSFMTSTFLSSKRYNNSSTLANKTRCSTRYTNMANSGGGGRSSCANAMRRSRQNVAIATQVLNPSAIGGSLKGQRTVKHFGPPDDDEEGFITYRRSGAWKKLCYYGSGIVAVILILMAIILSVGYMQSEKHKKFSRSVKLIQEKNPSSFIYLSTTPEPPSADATDSHEFFPTAQSSFLLSSRKEMDSSENDDPNEFLFSSGESAKNIVEEDEDEDEYSVNYSHHGGDERRGLFHGSEVDLTKSTSPLVFLTNSNNDRSAEAHDSDAYNKENNGSSKGESHDEVILSTGDKLDNDLDAVIVEQESVDDVNNNDDWKSDDGDDSVKPEKAEEVKRDDDEERSDEHAMASEVKVKPPEDFVFSIEIPIYTPNNTISVAPTKDYLDLEKRVEESSSSKPDAKSDKNRNDNETHTQSIESDKETLTGVEKFSAELEEDEPQKGEEQSKEAQKSDSGNISRSSEAEDEAQEKGDIVTERYHAVFHTSLFDDAEPTSDEKKPVVSSSAKEPEEEDESIIHASSEENVTLHFPDRSDSSEEQVLKRSGGRNMKIKILKNDKVLNLKATFTPPPPPSTRSASLFQNPESSESTFEEKRKPSRKGQGFPQALRLKDERRSGLNQKVLNKTLALKQRSKAPHKSSDYGNIKDFLLDTGLYNRPITSESHHISFPVTTHSEDGEELEERPRLLSSSNPLLSNIETYLKNILTAQGVPILDSNKDVSAPSTPESKSLGDQHHHATTSDFGTNFALSLNQFIPPSHTPGETSTGLSPAQLSKRTYNDFHSAFASPSSQSPVTQNYFDHLLGQHPNVGNLGNPSATAASLSNYYAPLFPTPGGHNFDIGASSTDEVPALAPGSVPFDLASSFIQVGLPTPSSNTRGHHHQHQPSQQGFYNGFSPAAVNTGLSPEFSFSPPKGNEGESDGIGTLTTAGGHPPTYNTISQGINLLNMISGTYPTSYFHDQVYHPTGHTPVENHHHHQPDLLNQPTDNFQFGNYQTATNPLVGYDQDEFLKSIGAIPSRPPPPQSVAHQSTRIYGDEKAANHRVGLSSPRHSPSNSPGARTNKDRGYTDFSEDDEEDSDQVPAASSFTTNILTTFQSPAVKKLTSTVESSTLRNTIAYLTKSKRRLQADDNARAKPSKKSQSEPKSFSFQILPGKTSPRKDTSTSNPIEDTLNNLNVDVIHSTLDSTVTGKSRKKASVSMEFPGKLLAKNSTLPLSPETASATSSGTRLRLKGKASKASKSSKTANKNVISPRHATNLPPTTNAPSSNNLKSGFFTV